MRPGEDLDRFTQLAVTSDLTVIVRVGPGEVSEDLRVTGV